MGVVVADRRKLSAELEDPQTLATHGDHGSWPFPFKPPSVHVKCGELVLLQQPVLRLEEYASWSGKAASQ